MSAAAPHTDGPTEPALSSESEQQETSVQTVSPVTPTIKALQNLWRWVNQQSDYYWTLRVEGIDLREISERYDLTRNQRYYRWKQKGEPNFLILLSGSQAPVQLLLARAEDRDHLSDEVAYLEDQGASVRVTDLRCSSVEVGRWELHAQTDKKVAHVSPSSDEVDRYRRRIRSVTGPTTEAKEQVESILVDAKRSWFWVAHKKALGDLEDEACKHLAEIKARRAGMPVRAAKARLQVMRPSRWSSGRAYQYLGNVGEATKEQRDESASSSNTRDGSDGPPGGRKRSRTRYVRQRSHLPWTGRHEDAIEVMPSDNRGLKDLLVELGIPRADGQATGARACVQKMQEKSHKIAKILGRYRRRHGHKRAQQLIDAIDRYADREGQRE